ncbi:MAG: hypothetical protein RLZZ562_2322 [Planctomycetota bacterium]
MGELAVTNAGLAANDARITTHDVARAAITAAIAMCGYLALGQNLMHGFDAFYYLRDVDQGQLHHPRIAFYLPIAWAFTKLMSAFSVREYEAMRALSSLGAAIGVACVQLAAQRLGLSRGRCVAAAAAAASLPAVAYSASVVEVDAVFFGCACASWLPFSRLLTTQRWSAAIATGVATAIGAGFHASGHLLALQLCGLAAIWDWPQRPLLQSLPRAALLLLTHLALATLIAFAFGVGEQGEMATNTVGHAFPLDFVPHVATHEFVLAYAPIGLCALAALLDRPRIGAGLAYAICLCGYVFVSTKILGYQRYAKEFLSQGDIVERGSFLLALGAPMALLTARMLPARALLVAIAASAAFAVVQVKSHDWPNDPPAAADAIEVALQRGPIEPFVADTQEWAWIARRHPQVRGTLYGSVATDVAAARAKDPTVVTTDMVLLWFAMEYDRAMEKGAQYVVTQRALDAMEASGDPAIAPAAKLLLDRYRFELIADAGPLKAFRLTRK